MNASETMRSFARNIYCSEPPIIPDKISSKSDLRVNQTDIPFNPEWEVLNRDSLGNILIMQSIRKDTRGWDWTKVYHVAPPCLCTPDLARIICTTLNPQPRNPKFKMGSEVAELKKIVESLSKEVTRLAGKLLVSSTKTLKCWCFLRRSGDQETPLQVWILFG